MVEGLDTGDPLGPSVGTSAPFGTGGTVGIIGLGGMGSAAAYHLARRGVRVVGFEQFACAHDRGSSHGDSRVIREAYFEHSSYVPLVQRAYDLWSETQDLAGEELLTICGGLMLGRPDDEVVVGTLASARRWDIPHQILTAADVRWRYPKLAVPDDHVGVLERRGGFVRPEASVRVHNRLASELGATLHFETRLLGWQATEEGLVLTTDAGPRRVDRLVVTAGPWAGRLLAELGLPLAVERVVMFWFEADDWDAYAVGRFPVHLWDDPEGRRLYGFPAVGTAAGGVKVAFFRAGGGGGAGQPVDPDTVDREVAEEEIEAMRGHLADRVPGLSLGRCVRAKVCLYTVTPDEHFVVGLHPHDGRIVLAAGFSGHGFKFVPVIGEICADLATRGRTRHDVGLFRPDRFS